MNRSGTITYRNPDGEFRGQQRIQKEEQMPDPIGVAFFARFLLKYKDQFTEEREQGGEIFNRNCDLHGAGSH